MASEHAQAIDILCVAQIATLKQDLIGVERDALPTTENKVALKLVQVLVGRFTLYLGAHEPIEHF